MTKTKILSLFIKANKITLSFIIQKVSHFQSQRSVLFKLFNNVKVKTIKWHGVYIWVKTVSYNL